MGTVRYTVFDGEITSEYRNGVLHDYLVDPLGSTVALVDNTQTITDTFSYSAFGEVLNRTGTTPTPFQYVGSKGYYRDSSTRTHVRARNFYVNLGKWSTQDPIGFRGGDFNLYRYVGNAPIMSSDASGLSGIGEMCLTIGGGLVRCPVPIPQLKAIGAGVVIVGGGILLGQKIRDWWCSRDKPAPIPAPPPSDPCTPLVRQTWGQIVHDLCDRSGQMECVTQGPKKGDCADWLGTIIRIAACIEARHIRDSVCPPSPEVAASEATQYEQRGNALRKCEGLYFRKCIPRLL